MQLRSSAEHKPPHSEEEEWINFNNVPNFNSQNPMTNSPCYDLYTMRTH
jgi:hypothetical protein